MSEEQILKKVQEIFRDVFDDETLIIVREMSAKDIEDWDSLAQINLIVAIEQDFHIKFRLEEIQGLKNVGNTIDLISEKVMNRTTA